MKPKSLTYILHSLQGQLLGVPFQWSVIDGRLIGEGLVGWYLDEL